MTEKISDQDNIKNAGFLLVGNAWENRPTHACKPEFPALTFCGILYRQRGWQKSRMPTSEFCAKCRKALNKMGYQVSVTGIVKVQSDQ